ncbi:MAG: hypothetical protein KDD42_07080 [Bdellovibrionales bacterium]|nr:hypothetical protein [Bdellovibrionales bacterium]
MSNKAIEIIQVFLIAVVVRFAMLKTGLAFINIPFFDSLVRFLIRYTDKLLPDA